MSLEELSLFKEEAMQTAKAAVEAIEALLNRGEESLSHDELADALVDAMIALESIANYDCDDGLDEDDIDEVLLTLLMGGEAEEENDE